MNVTVQYEMIVFNVGSGHHVMEDIFRISDIVYEEEGYPGVCLMFDKELNLVEMVASYNDILYMSCNQIKHNIEYYCMIYEMEIPFESVEVDNIFDGINNGSLDIMILKEEEDIPIISSNN